MNGKVFIIDDEPGLRHTLTRLIQGIGCEVLSVGDGDKALDILRQNNFDLVYLDIHLPGVNGLQILKSVRKDQANLPVILLTGHATLQSALEAIRLGATDYLLKPIDPEVLVARTRMILQEQAVERRVREIEEQIASLQTELHALRNQERKADVFTTMTEPDERFLKRGRLILDLQTRRGTLGEKVLSIPPTAFEYLIVLARKAPAVVSYEALVMEAQGYQDIPRFEAQEMTKWHIHALRQSMEPDPARPLYILNVRGIGYRFAAEEH